MGEEELGCDVEDDQAKCRRPSPQKRFSFCSRDLERKRVLHRLTLVYQFSRFLNDKEIFDYFFSPDQERT